MTEAAAIADAVRRACLEAALAAYEDAGIRGVCEEGRWEAAVGAIRTIDLEPVVRRALPGRRGSATQDPTGSDAPR